MQPYKVALIQQETQVIVDVSRRDEIVERNTERILELVRWAFNRTGQIRLAVFSEYGVIGQYRPRSVDEWLALAETIPGPVTERLSAEARRLGCFIAGNLYERDDSWPGRLWNTTFIISDEGEVILKYRKNNGPNNLNVTYTGPGDVYDEYVERYGELSMFPVVDTSIGVLGALTCYDITFPEMSRALALQGAEVLIHPTAEPTGDVDQMWDVFRRARAYENTAYFLSSCAGAFVGSDRPKNGYRGNSQIIDHTGRIVSIAVGSGESVCLGTVDVNAVREVRSRAPGRGGHEHNQLVQLRSELFAEVYAKAGRWPNGLWSDHVIESVEEARSTARDIRDRLIAKGALKLPEYETQA